MGFMTMQYQSSDFDFAKRMMTALPFMSNQILGFVGNEAKKLAKKNILSGQALQYRDRDGSPSNPDSSWEDKKGRPKVSYGIRYAQYVTIRSYPANFFTVMNNVQRRRNIWGTLKYMTAGQLDSILKQFDTKYLQKEFEQFAENPLSRDRF